MQGEEGVWECAYSVLWLLGSACLFRMVSTDGQIRSELPLTLTHTHSLCNFSCRMPHASTPVIEPQQQKEEENCIKVLCLLLTLSAAEIICLLPLPCLEAQDFLQVLLVRSNLVSGFISVLVSNN